MQQKRVKEIPTLSVKLNKIELVKYSLLLFILLPVLGEIKLCVLSFLAESISAICLHEYIIVFFTWSAKLNLIYNL